MADMVIVYWKDIPAQVKSGSGRKSVRRELSPRFIEAIDRAAMRCGAKDSDSYMAHWRTSDPVLVEDDPQAAVDAACARLEAEWDDARLSTVVAAGGVNA